MGNGVDIRGTNGGSVTVGLPAPPDLEVRTVPNDPEAGARRVYFLYCAGFVKIGVTSKLLKRMSNLQSVTPFHAQAVLLIPGGRLTEQYLHFLFDEYHARGEWFHFGPRIREAIERLAPSYCQDWLREEEEAHRRWVADEAERLGLPSRSQEMLS